ncbi:MAG TPA: DUF1489 domain-containing protein [Acidocella sp.]|nr:DUF1489 domain-containing protein [Acidocella sp.]
MDGTRPRVHLVKLCVGVRDVAHLELVHAQEARNDPPLRHVTRHAPKRREELLAGGSLYWVIGGVILVRQRLLDIRPEQTQDGTQAALVLDPELVRVEGRAMRAFQGWRYLDPQDAPADLGPQGNGAADMPESMRRELAALGLL